jgi:hypothetical protein
MPGQVAVKIVKPVAGSCPIGAGPVTDTTAAGDLTGHALLGFGGLALKCAPNPCQPCCKNQGKSCGCCGGGGGCSCGSCGQVEEKLDAKADCEESGCASCGQIDGEADALMISQIETEKGGGGGGCGCCDCCCEPDVDIC